MNDDASDRLGTGNDADAREELRPAVDPSEPAPEAAPGSTAADEDREAIPGIERPDVDHAFTQQQFESVDKLGEPFITKENRPEGSPETVQNTDVQNVVAATDSGAPATALSSVVGAEALNTESAFNDMRDPMAAADGSIPTKTEVVRLGIGFTLSAVLCAIPWVALSSIILPAVLENINAGAKESMLGTINAVGSIVALLANIIFGTLSDLTRSKWGKRTPWIIAGGIVAGLSVGAVSLVQHSFGAVLFFWCMAQLGYNVMLAPFVATMSDRVPDKFRGRVSGFYGAGIAAGQTIGSFVGARLLAQGQSGMDAGWMMGLAVFALIGIAVVAIWPREKSNEDEPREKFSLRMLLLSFRPPCHAPDFYYALAGRTLMMGGYWMINSYQLYIAQDYVYAGDPDGGTKAAALIATMSVITLIVSLVAALGAGPLTDKIGMRKVPVALASCMFALGAAMPLLFHSAVGMYLFAAIAGLGYGTYNAIDQALNVSVLPNPEEAGKDLGILNLANTLSTVIGSVFTSLIVVIVKSVMGVTSTPSQAYTVVFIVAIVIVLIAAWLIMRIKKVR